ncbi:MAG: hypothetical protein Q7U16_06955 [Agitococcus sp.]|nr:hypothetical protein [Agitococcus sp.]
MNSTTRNTMSFRHLLVIIATIPICLFSVFSHAQVNGMNEALENATAESLGPNLTAREIPMYAFKHCFAKNFNVNFGTTPPTSSATFSPACSRTVFTADEIRRRDTEQEARLTAALTAFDAQKKELDDVRTRLAKAEATMVQLLDRPNAKVRK